MSYHTAERYHDFSYGHRVVGHENKCRHLHGHNGRVHFICRAQIGVAGTDSIGRVIDFGEIKSRLCMWLEDNWDHKFLAWSEDHIMREASQLVAGERLPGEWEIQKDEFNDSIVWLTFNPTAENMAQYLVTVIAPVQLLGTGIELVSCRIEETQKCTASFHSGQ